MPFRKSLTGQMRQRQSRPASRPAPTSRAQSTRPQVSRSTVTPNLLVVQLPQAHTTHELLAHLNEQNPLPVHAMPVETDEEAEYYRHRGLPFYFVNHS
jgi:hypothetical protein